MLFHQHHQYIHALNRELDFSLQRKYSVSGREFDVKFKLEVCSVDHSMGKHVKELPTAGSALYRCPSSMTDVTFAHLVYYQMMPDFRHTRHIDRFNKTRLALALALNAHLDITGKEMFVAC